MKKFLKKVFIFVLFIGFMGSAINIYMVHSMAQYIKTIENYEKQLNEEAVIIVLGSLVYDDGRLAPILKDRVDMAIQVYEENYGGKILLSGDHGQKNYDEVNAMKAYVLSFDIPPEDIFMDHAGFSTYETFYRARDVFGVKKTLVITQEYHMTRALYIARKMGIEAYGISADRQRYAAMPYFERREFLARIKDFFMVNVLKLKPKYLGDFIDINGDGRLSWD